MSAVDVDDVIPATERGGYLVASESQPGVWWFVTVLPGRLVCPCPRGAQIERERGDVGAPAFCRHGRRVLAFTDAQGIAARRPSAPPHPGFVD